MPRTKVKGHERKSPFKKGKKIINVKPYTRKKRPIGKKKIKAKPIYVKIQYYTDEFGQFRPERDWTVLKKKP